MGKQLFVGDWQGEVEHVQSGQRWTFVRLDELLGFLRRLAEGAEVWDASAEGRVVRIKRLEPTS